MKLGYVLLINNIRSQEIAAEEGISTDQPSDDVVPTWAEWEKCSKNCGGGIRIRIDKNCEEECTTETENCNAQECVWSEWNQTECSKSCGDGIAIRTRNCPEEHHW